jgi:sugar phosphate isomerase/epimerase
MQTRRSFLRLAGLTAAVAPAAFGIEPFKRPGSPRMRLALAGYSFRDFFVHGGRKSAGDGKRIDLFQFIDYCADHGCQGAELTSYYFAPDIDAEYLLKLRRHAFLRGIAISGTAVGNNFAVPKGEKRDAEIASVKKWIGYAAKMNAPHIRIFAGAAPKDLSKAEAKKLCVDAVEECAAEAGKHGIFLGLENHGGIVAEPQDLVDMIREIKSPWVGINLDTGNFRTDDPYRDLEMCAPYTVNVQVKSEISRRGQKKELADLKRLTKMLRDVNYQGFVALEYEAAEDPWTAVPRLLKELGQALHA